jgi:hypothetical protein
MADLAHHALQLGLADLLTLKQFQLHVGAKWKDCKLESMFKWQYI